MGRSMYMYMCLYIYRFTSQVFVSILVIQIKPFIEIKSNLL